MNAMSCCSRKISLCWCIGFFIVAGTILTLALIYSSQDDPRELEFTVTNASIARFEFSASNNHTLSYDLALNIVVRNPNAKGGLFFDRFQVIASYRDRIFAMVVANSTTPFYLGREGTVGVRPALEGKIMLLLEDSDVEFYDLETDSGVYTIDAKIALRLRNVTFVKTKSQLEPPKIDCDNLRIPIRDGKFSEEMLTRTGGKNFNATICRNVYVFSTRINTTIKTTSFGGQH